MNESLSTLNNPIWHSLNSRHSSSALAEGIARRFDPEIGPLSAIPDQNPEGFRDLARLFPPDEAAVLFLNSNPMLPDDWTIRLHQPMEQMICLGEAIVPPNSPKVEVLGPVDIPEMLALTALTEPGPFRARTAELGGFFGIREAGRLAAMTGQRLALETTDGTGITEISAVCTHPDFRGRGYARILVAAVAEAIRQRGEIPILHVLASNAAAIKVYESVGFSIRQTLHVVAATAPTPAP